MEENLKEKEKFDNKFLIGITISVLPFLGYLITFSYEYGYSTTFNIPPSFISIKLENTISVTFAIILIFLYLGYTIHSASSSIFDDILGSSIKRFLLFNIFFYSILFGILILFYANFILWISFFLLLFNHLIRPLINPLFRKNKAISYKEQLERELKSYLKADSFLNRLMNKYIRMVILSSMFIFFILVLTTFAGILEAKGKTDFKILNNDTSKVVVCIYDNNIILVKTNELKSKNINNIFVVNETRLDSFKLTTFTPFQEVNKKEIKNPQSPDTTKTK